METKFSSPENQKLFCQAAIEALRLEWKTFIQNIKFNAAERRLIKEPVFALAPGVSWLGRWYGGTKQTLELRLELVMEHPWYAVVDVLLHEIAHQLKEVFYPNEVEPPHGPVFRQVCLWIGANPSASTELTELDSRVFAGGTGSGNELLEKVRKLLSLAERGDEHEAESALVKARSLMTRYGLSEEDLDDGEQYTTVYLGKANLRQDTVEGYLGGYLHEFWSVRTIWITVPDLQARPLRWLRQLAVCGTVSNCRIASYVYDFIHHFAFQRLTSMRVRTGRRIGVRDSRDYMLGLLRGLRSVMKQQRDELDAHTLALVEKNNGQLDHFFDFRFPSRLANRSSGFRVNQDMVDAGEQDGRNLKINPGLEQGGPRLLNQ